MLDEAAALPDDAGALRALVISLRAVARERSAERDLAYEALKLKTLELEKLRMQLAKLRRTQFGQSSEKLAREVAQLELAIEEIEASAETVAEPPAPAADPAEAAGGSEAAAEPTGTPSADARRRPARRPLPSHLPRETVVHPAATACPHCGGAVHAFGEDKSEVLEYVPGHFRIVEHVRPKVSCRSCEAISQAPTPALPIERGRPGPGLLSHVLISKYCDHLPLYRQAEIYARDGVALARSTLAGWVGRAAFELRPLIAAVAAHVLAGDKIHGDDTTVPVLAPGTGKTATGRLWAYVRDDRPFAGAAPPAVFYCYSPDRKGIRPREHLAGFRGILQADGYAGFGELYRSGSVSEVACFAHVRRKFFDIHKGDASPLALAALNRIGALYAIEEEARGLPPDLRRVIRQRRAGPLLDELKAWMEASLRRISGKSELAGAIRYGLSRWTQLTRYRDDGRLEIDNNAAERAIRGLVLGRKNWLFAGSDDGGERAAAIYTLTETAKLNRIDPAAWLTDVLKRLATHPAKRVAELLPWNWAAARDPTAAAA
ncbi:MAG TPA: IS66 family transposase [Caulobacteraceae bacterium]|nr:IS66 family transposase [Caulobacteraceae bacterium]